LKVLLEGVARKQATEACYTLRLILSTCTGWDVSNT